jgi:hypothetical protein
MEKAPKKSHTFGTVPMVLIELLVPDMMVFM